MNRVLKVFGYDSVPAAEDDAVPKVDVALAWRRLSGDVMRAPQLSNLFSWVLGTGTQIGTVFLLLVIGAYMEMMSWLEFRPVVYWLFVALLSMTNT